MEAPDDVTALLLDLRNGDAESAHVFWSRVYDELRRIAHRQLQKERAGHTLSTTALVHEAYLRLIDQTHIVWEDRLHFYAAASRVMRHILIDYARRKNAQKRGAEAVHLRLEEVVVSAESSARVFLALDRALDRLSETDERLGRVVEYRFFGGMKEREIAELLGLSTRTVRRDWRKAKGWLTLALTENEN